MDQPRFKYLLDRYILGEISPEDRQELARLAADGQYEELLNAILIESIGQQSLTGNPPDEKIKQRLSQRLPGHDFWAEGKIKQSHRLFLRWIAAAAVLAIVAITGLLLVTRNHTPINPEPSAAAIAPANNKAVLTLGNGKRIVLEQTANGAIAQQSGTKIIKLNNGRLVYQNLNQQEVNKTDSGAAFINTLSTPRGGQIQLVLPDGTAVWLNSASSLHYPAAFNGPKRVVELTGEGYFEVAANSKQPFQVKVNGVLVDVLGTSFNIHAYPDEPVVTTTLVQGKVKVTSQQKARILTPGEQAIASGAPLLTQTADLEQVLAWKNGLFIFQERTLPDILREISRWYDIDIEWRSPASDEKYGGIINRNSTLPKVLALLQQNGIRHFRLEGRKVIVLP